MRATNFRFSRDRSNADCAADEDDDDDDALPAPPPVPPTCCHAAIVSVGGSGCLVQSFV